MLNCRIRMRVTSVFFFFFVFQKNWKINLWYIYSSAPSLEFKSLYLDLRINVNSWQELKTSLRRKESVGIPKIHKIAPKDRKKLVENFQGFYPLNSWPPLNSDSHLPLLSQNPKAPLVAPELKFVTVRWLTRRASIRLKREWLPICP